MFFSTHISTPFLSCPVLTQWWTLGHRDTKTLNIQQMAGAQPNLPMSPSPPKHKSPVIPGAPLHPPPQLWPQSIKSLNFMLLNYDCRFKNATKTSIIDRQVSVTVSTFTREQKLKVSLDSTLKTVFTLLALFWLHSSPLLFLSSSPSGVCSSRQ